MVSRTRAKANDTEAHVCLGPNCKCKVTRTRSNIFIASKAQERKLGHNYKAAGFKNARRVPGSGSISQLPADVDPGEWFLGEAKETRGGRYVVDPDDIRKIAAQAKQMQRPWWVFHVWAANKTDNFTKVVMIAEDTFFELLRRLKAAEDE